MKKFIVLLVAVAIVSMIVFLKPSEEIVIAVFFGLVIVILTLTMLSCFRRSYKLHKEKIVKAVGKALDSKITDVLLKVAVVMFFFAMILQSTLLAIVPLFIMGIVGALSVINLISRPKVPVGKW